MEVDTVNVFLQRRKKPFLAFRYLFMNTLQISKLYFPSSATKSKFVRGIAHRRTGRLLKDVKDHVNIFSETYDYFCDTHTTPPAFRPDKQTGIDPHNNSYHFSARPGESILDDANEDIVNTWLMDLGVNVPHHRQSESHKFHGKNARLGLPYQPVPQYREIIGDSVSVKYF